MATDMGKLQNKEIIMLPIIWERDASRGIFKGSTIVLWTILNFVHLNSNMIKMKTSVSRWTSLRKKISPIIWRKQNTFDTEGIGGFLTIMTEHLDDWKIVLTSTRRCPHYTIYTKNLENDNSGQCHSGSINAGTNHRVLHPVGGNEAILGGAHNNSNESPHMSDIQSDMIERWNLLFADFHDLFLFCCSWIVYSWRRSIVTDGVRKDNTSQDRCRSVNLYKEFVYRWEIE